MSKIKNWALRKAIAAQTRDEEGQGLVEYGLILALIGVAAVVSLGVLSGAINGLLESITF